MSKMAAAAAWEVFWSSSAGQSGNGCLPDAQPFIAPVQAAVWLEATQALRRGARVLDLATGAGAVLMDIQATRSDLKLVGVDSSGGLPKAPKGVSLMPRVAIESLPFGDKCFDLVTSQYGFEYSDTALSAHETARVLKSGRRFVFILHHADGPIVGHSIARGQALQWASVDSGLLNRARELVNGRRLFPIPIPPSISLLLQEARRLFPSESVAEEFVVAVLRTLDWGRHSPVDRQLDTLAELEQLASSEVSRINALTAAACSEERLAHLIAHVQDAGLAWDQPRELREKRSGRPFAWRLTGYRA